jgi:exoribonuclease R
MLHWSRRLRSKRRAAGAVELDSFDQKKFSFAKAANGSAEPVAVGEHEHPEMCSMIEQFMVLANVYVAERIYRAFPHAALLRYHPLPRDDSLIEFERFAQSLGVKVDTSSNKALADSLANLDAQAVRSMSHLDYLNL